MCSAIFLRIVDIGSTRVFAASARGMARALPALRGLQVWRIAEQAGEPERPVPRREEAGPPD